MRTNVVLMGSFFWREVRRRHKKLEGVRGRMLCYWQGIVLYRLLSPSISLTYELDKLSGLS